MQGKIVKRRVAGRREPRPGARPKSPEPRRKKLFRKIVVGLGLVIAAILTAVGTNVGDWLWTPATASGSAAASPSVSSSASGTQTSDVVPFAVDVTEDYHDCGAFALPAVLPAGQSYAQLANADEYTDAEWGQFLLPLRGSPVGTVSIVLTFSGVQGVATRITDIEVKQVGKPTSVYSGTFIPVPHQGGGDNSYNFAVDLSKPNPQLEGLNGQQNFPGFQINVNQNLDSTVDIDMTAGPHAYAWDFVVDYDVNGVGKSKQVTEPGGMPFTLTGRAPWYGEVFQSDGGGYQRTDTHTSGAS